MEETPEETQVERLERQLENALARIANLEKAFVAVFGPNGVID